MTDQIEELFADLRAEVLPTVRPPGTETLRRAVRRRRAVTSVAAAVTVLGLAALITVARPGSGPEPVVSPPSAAPTYSDDMLTAGITATLKVEDATVGLSEIILDTGNGPRESRRQVLGGSYSIRMTCYGSGSMDVTANGTAVETVPCDTAGTVRVLPVVVPEPSGQLAVRVAPHVAGPGQAAFGYVADLAQADKSRWQETARNALGERTGDFVGAGSDFVSESGFSTGFEGNSIEPGRYRVRAICFGFGTARLSVAPSTDGTNPSTADEATVRCSPDAPRSASVTYTASTKGLSYRIEPDADAAHRSAVATFLERY
ncbi:hypothetical protein QLQ12_08355 [Actinoplanes sp. NEAU-A12]|uniref:Serine/threonine protein kinase n=1 Tax=Actinoplanes sandaracinus TaxID=3045177 RepID=A0ABT6WFU7_9ACTN|nr:hypothetical protein [Actinoplanes sandaracinus]MDI6098611.1 hypothetical protein [Actinoplanes sandaracinus]